MLNNFFNIKIQKALKPHNKGKKKDVLLTKYQAKKLHELKQNYQSSYSGITRDAVRYLIQVDNKTKVTRAIILSNGKRFIKSPLSFNRISVCLNDEDIKSLTGIKNRTKTDYSKIIRFALTMHLLMNFSENEGNV